MAAPTLDGADTGSFSLLQKLLLDGTPLALEGCLLTLDAGESRGAFKTPTPRLHPWPLHHSFWGRGPGLSTGAWVMWRAVKAEMAGPRPQNFRFSKSVEGVGVGEGWGGVGGGGGEVRTCISNMSPGSLELPSQPLP